MSKILVFKHHSSFGFVDAQIRQRVRLQFGQFIMTLTTEKVGGGVETKKIAGQKGNHNPDKTATHWRTVHSLRNTIYVRDTQDVASEVHHHYCGCSVQHCLCKGVATVRTLWVKCLVQASQQDGPQACALLEILRNHWAGHQQRTDNSQKHLLVANKSVIIGSPRLRELLYTVIWVETFIANTEIAGQQ